MKILTPSVKIEECFLPVKNSEYSTANEGHKTGSKGSGSSKTLLYILIGAAAIGLLVFAELKLTSAAINTVEKKMKSHGRCGR